MREATGDLWTTPAKWRVITTNGFIKADGRAVMGRGCAKEAAEKYPVIARVLGTAIQQGGNHVHILGTYKIISFPVKHAWYEMADLDLIKQSALELAALINEGSIEEPIAMVRPGCGNGRRAWEEVKPLISSILPDSVVVVTNGEE